MIGQPHYDLALIQARAVDPAMRSISTTAYVDAQTIGIDEGGVWRCVQSLTPNDFYKKMPAKKMPGLWQDVYKPRYSGHSLYVKVQVLKDGTVRVISFKEDESA